ncbi:MAG: response regulator transcription factor [Arcobacteraceae bacterium]
MKYQVLLIEDDEQTAFLIKNFLEEYDLKVDFATTVTNAISNIKFEKYSIILLDLNLPDFNGYEVLKFLNSNKINIPVIVLSAYSDKQSKLQAFKLGACDYMVKPIDPEELEARIWVHIKNSSAFDSNKNGATTFKITNNSVLFNDTPLKLTKTEFEILSHLIQHKNSTLPREKLLDSLSSVSQSERSLDYHIKNLRLKLGDTGSNPKYLITEYGVGYKLMA